MQRTLVIASFNAKGRPGVTLVELLVVIGILTIVISLLTPGVQYARESARRIACDNKLRQLGLAAHNFESAWKRLPTGHEGQNDQYPFQTWTTKLLPYLEQDSLYQEIQVAYQKSRNPFEQTVHTRFNTVLSPYTCPSDSRVSASHVARGIPVALSSYVGVNGTDFTLRDGLLYFQSRVRFADVTDGLSNTMAIIERPPSADFYFGWWYAGFGSDFAGAIDSSVGTHEINAFAPDHIGAFCSQGPFQMQRRTIHNAQCGIFHPWSLHSVVNMVRADGSVTGISYEISLTVLMAAGTRAGAETAAMLD